MQDYLFFLKRYLPVATLGQTKFNVLLGMDNAFLKKLQEWKNQLFYPKCEIKAANSLRDSNVQLEIVFLLDWKKWLLLEKIV